MKRILYAVLFGIAGWFGTAYVLALMLPTDTTAALPGMLVGPIPIVAGIVAVVVGCFVVRR